MKDARVPHPVSGGTDGAGIKVEDHLGSGPCRAAIGAAGVTDIDVRGQVAAAGISVVIDCVKNTGIVTGDAGNPIGGHAAFAAGADVVEQGHKSQG